MSSSDTPPPPPPPPPGGPTGPYSGQPGAPYPYGAPAATDAKATWSLVLGILAFLCCGIFAGIPAIVLGRNSMRDIDASGGRLTGRGMAKAGFILGIIATVLGVLGLILAAILFATGSHGTSGSCGTVTSQGTYQPAGC